MEHGFEGRSLDILLLVLPSPTFDNIDSPILHLESPLAGFGIAGRSLPLPSGDDSPNCSQQITYRGAPNL